MAGMKKATFRGGGGFLNDVDGKIIGVKIRTETPFANAGGYFYGTLTVKVDGKDDPDSTSLFMGGTEEEYTPIDGNESAVISADGKGFSRGTPWADFINTVEDVAPTEFGAQATNDDDSVIDYTPLVNVRLRFKQQPLDATELGKLKAKGKKTCRTDATGKEWPLTKLVATQFYGYEAATKDAKSAGKKTAPAVSDIPSLASEVLAGILKRAPKQTLTVAKLSTPVLQAMLKHEQKAQKEAVRAYLMDADNLAVLDGFRYDAEAETVSIAA